jgi:hypothetical protein
MGNPDRVMFMLQFSWLFRVIAGEVDSAPEVPEALGSGHKLPDAAGLGELVRKAGVAAVV